MNLIVEQMNLPRISIYRFAAWSSDINLRENTYVHV